MQLNVYILKVKTERAYEETIVILVYGKQILLVAKYMFTDNIVEEVSEL